MYTPENFLNDIPMSTAVDAHSGTSFVPEKRGESLRQNYAECMAEFFAKVLAIAGEAGQAEALESLERYRQGYRDRYLNVLRRRSRIMSTMIAGPSNFPTRRNEKANNAYENGLNELVEWSQRVERKIISHFTGSDSIRTGSSEAVAQLEKKVAKLEAWQKFMKEANKVIKSAKLDTDEKVDAIMALDDDLTEADARKIVTVPDCYGGLGYQSFSMTNNNAKLKAAKEQLEKARKLATQVTTETIIGKVRMVNNCEEDRLQLFFPERTSKEIYALLSGHGFRYTPSKSTPGGEGCFQAYRGANADYWAKVIIKQYNDENPS